MSDGAITIVYDGGDASRNAIDARLFGQSLQGLDRMVSDCIILLTQERLPKRGERAPLLLKAKEPEAGSVTVQALVEEGAQFLAFGIPIIQIIGPEIVGHYVSTVLDWFRKDQNSSTDLAITKMAEMHRDALAALGQSHRDALEALDRKDERSHLERMDMLEMLRTTIRSSGGAANDYAAPIGKSVDRATFMAGKAPPVLTSTNDAEAIRDSQKLDWHTPRNIILATDGFKYHTSALSVENPEREGFLMAEVNDPVFDEDGNPYTIAAQKRAKIEVLARKGYKNGRLAKIMILDFIREIDADAA